MLVLPFYFSGSMEPSRAGDVGISQRGKYTHFLSFLFLSLPTLHSFLFSLLFIPQHGTLQGLKEGFSWHGVNSDIECSNLESNQEDWGSWSICKAEESHPPLPFP